ncbi:MAG: deoxyguanosinetriphosphate triphosphohydrolase [Hyphomicrobiales bacterium]
MACQTSMASKIGFGGEERSVAACTPMETKGRLVDEPSSPTRTDFQRDRDRIVHSTAFRRLKHKTQVFIYHEGDHFRTRLTHTIEVAQIARAIARALRLNEDLAEALALAHDLGHTPFGHAGEDGLDHMMSPYGGFEHNAQTLRLVTDLERRYAAFDGLNLSWETLEGIVKHNGPLLTPEGTPTKRYEKHGVPEAIKLYNARHDLHLGGHASLEAQAAAIADDIAYNAHDIDDALRGGVFQLEHLNDVPLAGEILVEVRKKYPNLDRTRTTHELIRRLITRMIEDVIHTATANIEKSGVQSVSDVRAYGETLVRFSKAMGNAERGIKRFLFDRMYHTAELLRVRINAELMVADLFERYFEEPAEMSNDWANDIASISDDEPARARQVCDYVAGMTDRFAVQEHRRLFDVTPDLR